MRLATVRIDGELRAARVNTDTLTVLKHAGVDEVLKAQLDWGLLAEQDGAEIAIEDADFAPVVPNPGKIVCVGLNYSEHAGEAHRELPSYPILFAKYAEALIGARDDILIPAVSAKVDWEAELTIVIGRPARYVSESQAPGHIAGYTVANDISIRDWQRRSTQFLQGKTFEHTTPVGPYVVSADEIDVGNLRVQCTVDDEVVQDFSTAQMLFSPAYLVSYLSHVITLKPGDLILTGTGSGVGVVKDPPQFINPMSTVATEIENIGRLENRVVPDGADASHVPGPRASK
jgi:acylpyruvate hydrolase